MTFSLLGLVFLAALSVPNILWARQQAARPADAASPKENFVLLCCERAGQVLTTVLACVSFRAGPLDGGRLAALLGSLTALALYEVAWVRYFRSPRAPLDLYCPLARIPLPLATLPIAAFALLAVVNRSLYLFLAVGLLSIGHIGIHYQHKKELEHG